MSDRSHPPTPTGADAVTIQIPRALLDGARQEAFRRRALCDAVLAAAPIDLQALADASATEERARLTAPLNSETNLADSAIEHLLRAYPDAETTDGRCVAVVAAAYRTLGLENLAAGLGLTASATSTERERAAALVRHAADRYQTTANEREKATVRCYIVSNDLEAIAVCIEDGCTLDRCFGDPRVSAATPATGADTPPRRASLLSAASAAPAAEMSTSFSDDHVAADPRDLTIANLRRKVDRFASVHGLYVHPPDPPRVYVEPGDDVTLYHVAGELYVMVGRRRVPSPHGPWHDTSMYVQLWRPPRDGNGHGLIDAYSVHHRTEVHAVAKRLTGLLRSAIGIDDVGSFADIQGVRIGSVSPAPQARSTGKKASTP